MSDDITYSPKPGSVPYRVLAFLQANPDEELTRGDIAVKFDCPGSSVDTALGIAVAREFLKRTRNSGGELVWILGRSKEFVLLPDTSAVAASSTASLGSSPFRPKQPPPDINLHGIVIRKGIRLLSPEERRRQEFSEWFDEFGVGDSAEFDEVHTPTLRTESKRHTKAKGSAWKIAPTAPGRYGIERTK